MTNLDKKNIDNIDYNLYKLFLYLYEEKNISKVANILFVSQPAISYSLKELEEQLNCKLFIRNNKGIIPTKSADKLYKYIKTAFNIILEVEENINNDNSLIIRVGVPSHISSFCLCPLINEFKNEYPNVKFEIVTKPTSSIMEMLATREIDLVIDLLPMPPRSDTTKVIYLKKLSNCFSYSKKIHKDYYIKNVKDLNKYPLILPSTGSPALNDLDRYMASKNVKLISSINCWTTESIVELVREGMGVGYFFEDFINNLDDKDDFEIIKFDGKLPYLQLGVAYCEELLTPVLSKFIELICKRNK